MNRNAFAVTAVGLLLAALLPTAAGAQLIPIKTVPVAAGDQFLVFPAKNLGMGGLNLATSDAFLDPFINPAKGSRLKGTRLLGSPTFDSISEQNGAGRTLPLTLLHGSDDWFMDGSIALQQLQSDDRDIFAPRPFFGETLLRDRSATNTYVFGLLGRSLPGRAVSVVASFRWAALSEVDGVDLLYAGAERVEQSGSRADIRLGLLAEAEDGRTFEAVGVFNEIDMTHEVSYAAWFWDRPVPEPTRRLETNLDHTRTWGVHLGYVQPIRDTGWRFGAGLTGNKKSHPKIPNYRKGSNAMTRATVQRETVRTGIGSVLVVDDDHSVLEMVRLTLERAGFEVLAAGSGEEALRIVDENPEPIDLLLTDIVMPGIRGTELAQQLERTRPGIGVLHMTGYAGEALARELGEARNLSLIAKPFSPRDLVRRVREVLRSR